jgi:hypothetical protein
MRIITITNKSKCYEEINSLLVILAALAIALEYRKTGKAIYKKGECIALEGHSLKEKIKLPIYGPIEVALIDKKPIEIKIEIAKLDLVNQSGKLSISVLEKTIYFIFMPIFVTFYENNYKHFEKHFGKKYNLWPDAWRMAWVVRNAMSHNGNIYFKELNTSPINWNVVSISPLDQNMELKTFLNFTDTLLLLFDMEESLKQ